MANKIKRQTVASQKKMEEYAFRSAIKESRRLKRLFKSPNKVLDAIYQQRVSGPALPPNSGYQRLYYVFRDLPRQRKVVFYEYLKIITEKGGGRLLTSHKHVNALHNIFNSIGSCAMRPLNEWGANKSRDLDKFLGTLLRHLFVEYEMPAFMDKAWTSNNNIHIGWYLHLGVGQNLRTAYELPFTISKKTAHCFMFAPNSLSIVQALRWAQVRAMNGTTDMAYNIATTILSEQTDATAEDFWFSVMRFLVKHEAAISLNQVNPIIDYLYSKKCLRRSGQLAGEVLPPEQPNISMKGRTVATLLKAMEEWHADMARNPHLYQYIQRGGRVVNEQANVQRYWTNNKDWWKKYTRKWSSFGIRQFDYIEGTGNNKKVFNIRHLKTAEALAKEGQAMNHCVGSYAFRCENNTSAIFTLRLSSRTEGLQTLVTIEVNADKNIVQARAKSNRAPSELAKRVIRLWATQNGLKITCYTMNR